MVRPWRLVALALLAIARFAALCKRAGGQQCGALACAAAAVARTFFFTSTNAAPSSSGTQLGGTLHVYRGGASPSKPRGCQSVRPRVKCYALLATRACPGP